MTAARVVGRRLHVWKDSRRDDIRREAGQINPMGRTTHETPLRYRWLRHDSKNLELEQRKATIVEVYQGPAMDEQIDKAMLNASSATEE